MKLFLTYILAFFCAFGNAQGVKKYPGFFGDLGLFLDAQAATPYVINPGDTLVLRASEPRSYFQLNNYHGTAVNPIVIINEGGQVNIRAMGFLNCTYFKIENNVVGLTYGFNINTPGTGGPAISVSGRSRCMDISGFDIYGPAYMCWLKTDHTGEWACVDSMLYNGGFSMDSIAFHDCRGRNIGQDAIYAGNTNPHGDDYTCGGVLRRSYPMHLSNFKIYNIIIDSANRTGIQLGLCTNGEIYNCDVRNVGYEWNNSQGNGIAIGGESTNIRVHHNYIDSTFNYGIFILGKGLNTIDSNVVKNQGMLKVQPYIDLDSLSNALGQKIAWGPDGIDQPPGTPGTDDNDAFPPHFDYDLPSRTLFGTYNQPGNIVMQPDFDYHAPTPADSSRIIIKNNIVGPSMAVDGSFQYVGGNANHINIIDFGKNPVSYFNYICGNTLEDLVTAPAIGVGTKHYFTTGCAIPTAPAPTVSAGSSQTITLPTSSVTLTGKATPASGQSITTYAWTKVSGPVSYTISTPATINTNVTGLTQGVYVFKLTVQQTDAQTNNSDVQITVNPAVVPPPPVFKFKFLINKTIKHK